MEKHRSSEGAEQWDPGQHTQQRRRGAGWDSRGGGAWGGTAEEAGHRAASPQWLLNSPLFRDGNEVKGRTALDPIRGNNKKQQIANNI